MMERFIYLTGQRFGRLIVLEKTSKPENSNKRCAYWKCLCDCGQIKVVSSQSLRDGSTKRCGCLLEEYLHSYHNGSSTHNESKTRLYTIWKNMRSRCYDKNNKAYKRYGGKGIIVCNEWKEHYEPFRDWALLNGYNDNLSIDRIDYNGNYTPKNCRWATIEEQANNKSNSRLYTYNGETKSIAQWAREYNIIETTLRSRLNSGKMTIEEALLTPIGYRYNKGK